MSSEMTRALNPSVCYPLTPAMLQSLAAERARRQIAEQMRRQYLQQVIQAAYAQAAAGRVPSSPVQSGQAQPSPIIPPGTQIWDAEIVEEIPDNPNRSGNPAEMEVLKALTGKGRLKDEEVTRYIDTLALPHKKKAEARYQMWHDRAPDQDIYTAFRWPTEQVVVGQATAIGYTSDKWHKVGEKKDYIHHFDRPYPRLIIQKPMKKEFLDARSAIGPWVKKLKPVSKNKRVKPPVSRAFIPLGYCLDIEFIRPDGMISNLDFKNSYEMPFLAVDTLRNVLIVVQEKGNGFAVLLDSPIVEITPRGIEN